MIDATVDFVICQFYVLRIVRKHKWKTYVNINRNFDVK